jgi:hypothetical protein
MSKFNLPTGLIDGAIYAYLHGLIFDHPEQTDRIKRIAEKAMGRAFMSKFQETDAYGDAITSGFYQGLMRFTIDTAGNAATTDSIKKLEPMFSYLTPYTDPLDPILKNAVGDSSSGRIASVIFTATKEAMLVNTITRMRRKLFEMINNKIVGESRRRKGKRSSRKR